MPQRSSTNRSTRRVTRSQTAKDRNVIDNQHNITDSTSTTMDTDTNQINRERLQKKNQISATASRKQKRSLPATRNTEHKRKKRSSRKYTKSATTTEENETTEPVTLEEESFVNQTISRNNIPSTPAEHTFLQQLVESLGDQSTTTEAAETVATATAAPYDPNAAPIFDILDALMDMPNMEFLPTDTFPQDQAAAMEALRLNQELQQLVKIQIDKIDKQMAKNDEYAKMTRLLSIKEARIQRERMDIHKYYSEKYDFFMDNEGNTPISLGDRQDTVELESERVRNWSVKEREQLSSGIHSEVQRILAYEHVMRNEPWRVWEVDNLSREEWENYPVDKLDWNRVSSLYVKTKPPMNCMIQWTTQDHPAINKSPWKNKESKELGELVELYGYEGNWERIASELKTDRTAGQCFSHYQAKFKGYDQKRPWTAEDDQALQDAVALIGERNWQQVAVLIGGRSGQQCLHRWVKSINPAIRRSRWTSEEDAALKASVAVYGAGAWSYIQRHIPGRTDMQCRERWTNVLDPNLVHGQFTPEEMERLKELVNKHGRKWSVIAEHMPGRTDNICLRTWNKMNQPPSKKKKKREPQVEETSDQQTTIDSQDVHENT
ncbi:hypothetical protein BCR42DRAFT_370116 [Absidia repens]|uniref:Homeodomain-like protein n=1 Tax=Absidia repens TaxID=90262 RepID=A0A1X2IQ89_9FUNG|nr:hypothetical protein BCR42DRAFT_370116 [Absidia repens]